ncbi:MAG: thermonuclease family protein, partial [Deltaproteobacteria bacterium]
FRQFYGETATLALHSFLAKAGASPLACIVRTAVDQPNDVFDTYGRLVGDIFIKAGGHEVNVNHWLAEHGWAFPTFYSSMSSSEIADVSALAETARKSQSGFWKQASANVLAFDSTLLYRKGGPPDPQDDRGSVILPKLFRRVATWAVAKKTKLVTGSFQKYLSAYPDACYATHDLLEQGLAAATHRRLDEFVTAQGVFTVQARDLVFQEATSRVVDRNGTPVHW